MFGKTTVQADQLKVNLLLCIQSAFADVHRRLKGEVQ